MRETETGKRKWTLREARADDLTLVRDLLKRCELPADDVSDAMLPGFVVAESSASLVGVAAIEVHGPHGLLRSVAVAPEVRGSGLGAELVRDRISWMQSQGIGSLYLLTTTAAPYFAMHNFVTVTRDSAPAEIQASSEFTDLCPSTAILMHFTGKHCEMKPMPSANHETNDNRTRGGAR